MATGSTGETPLALLSGDMSVWTADSFSHYLKGIEDEISGDVGQEVELVAHAPMLPKPATDLPGYRDSGSKLLLYFKPMYVVLRCFLQKMSEL